MDYFFIFGIFVLIILTYQDIKKHSVDARYNFMMHGMALSLISHYNYNILLVLIIILIGFLARKYLKKYIGVGDLNALHWIMYGLLIISYQALINFFFVFCIIVLIYAGLKYLIYKSFNTPTPFYPVIFASFLTNYIIYFL